MPAIVGIVAVFLAVDVGLPSVLATILANVLVYVGASLALGQVSKMFKKSGSSMLNANRLITSRQPIAPWTIAYGQNRLGGVITFLHTNGNNNETLYLVITLAGHQVNQIPNMYFDGVLVTVDGNGDATGYWAGFAHVEYSLGARDQAAYATLISDAPGYWTSAHRQRGRASAFVRLKWSTKKFPNGVPNITFDLNGRQVYDPRTGAIGYSNNAALCIADYLTNPDFGLCAQSKYSLASSMVTNGNSPKNLPSFSASALVDGDPTTAGFSLGSVPAGAYFGVDLGSGNSAEFRRFRIFMSEAGNTLEWDITYSDDGITYTPAAVNFLPDVAGWNWLELAPNGAHRYWGVGATNSSTYAGTGFVNEAEFWTSDVDTTQLIAAANICDEPVAVAEGTIKTYIATPITWSTLDQIVTPASMNGILAGMTLSIDVGSQQENVLVLAVTSTTFTAVFTKSHNRPAPGALVTAYGAAYGATISANITGSSTAQIVTPDAMGNIAVGSVLCIDQGNANQEYVTVTAITDTTFTAIFLLNHTGPVSVFQTETRYQINGSFTCDHTPAETIGRMNSAMAGSVAYIGGKWAIFPGIWTAPTISVSDTDLRGPMTVQTRLTHRDLYNGVKGTFISPTNNWQASDYPPYQDAAALLEDNNEYLWLDVELPFTISGASAQRLSKIALERTRKQITVQGQFKLTAYQVQPLDVIQFSHPRFNWVNKTFEVQTVTMAYQSDGQANGAGLAVGVDLTLRETDSTVFDWSPADEVPLSLTPATVMPRNTVCQPPTNMNISPTELIRNVDGVRQSFLTVTWTAPADQFVIDGGFIVIQYKKHTDTNWTQQGTVDGSVTTSTVGPVVDGIQYDVQIWAENASGVQSSAVTASATPTGTSVTLDTIADGTTYIRRQSDMSNENMLQNGDFTNGATDWTNMGTVSEADPWSVTRNCGRSSSLSGYGAIGNKQIFRVAPGDVYAYDFWYKTGGTGAWLLYRANFGDAYGPILNAPTVWTHFVAQYTVPSAVDYSYSLQFHIANSSSTADTIDLAAVNIRKVRGLDLEVADGSTFIRGAQFVGGVVIIDNADFEASASLVNGAPPGWAASGCTVSYETTSPQSGNQSAKLVISTAFGGLVSIRKFKVIPGELYRVSGYVMCLASTYTAQIQAAFWDKTGTFLGQAVAQSNATGWTSVSGTGIVPANAVYMTIDLGTAGGVVGTVWFDNVHLMRAATAFEVTPINTSGHGTSTSGALSQSGVSTTINVAASTMQFGDGTVSYNSGSVNPGSLGTWFVYADDPGYNGGAVTYQATATESTLYAANGRIFFGKVTTVSGGGAVSSTPPGSGGGRVNVL